LFEVIGRQTGPLFEVIGRQTTFSEVRLWTCTPMAGWPWKSSGVITASGLTAAG
jgi:hypothetical protein